MKIYKEGSTRTAEEDDALFASVKEIAANVRAKGDEALFGRKRIGTSSTSKNSLRKSSRQPRKCAILTCLSM